MTANQCPNSVIMIRPATFGFNPEAAASNSFQNNNSSLSPKEVRELAIREFDQFVQKLKDHEIEVHVFEDTPTPPKPDAVFPNNWLSVHQNGTLVTYPMEPKNRRSERRSDILEFLQKNYPVKKRIDFSHYEAQQQFLEGTGSIIFDHRNKRAYASHSGRTHKKLFENLCKQLNYESIYFHAYGQNGKPVYHTNVILSIGHDFAVFCTEATKEKEPVMKKLSQHKQVIEISYQQMDAFCGNCYQVSNKHGEHYLIMSETAHQNFSEKQLNQLQKRTNILPVSIPTIEQIGGGSARCMLTGIYL